MIRTILAALAATLVGACCNREQARKDPAAAESTSEANADTTASPKSTEWRRSPSEGTPAPKTPAEKRIAKADESWRNFDRAARNGEAFKTMAMLQSHRLLADQGLEFLPEADAKEVRSHNAAEFRKRVPTVLVPGETGRAEGLDNEIIVPSNDADRCAVLAKTWLKGDQATMLAGEGFRKIRCGDKDWGISLK